MPLNQASTWYMKDHQRLFKIYKINSQVPYETYGNETSGGSRRLNVQWLQF